MKNKKDDLNAAKGIVLGVIGGCLIWTGLIIFIMLMLDSFTIK